MHFLSNLPLARFTWKPEEYRGNRIPPNRSGRLSSLRSSPSNFRLPTVLSRAATRQWTIRGGRQEGKRRGREGRKAGGRVRRGRKFAGTVLGRDCCCIETVASARISERSAKKTRARGV